MSSRTQLQEGTRRSFRPIIVGVFCGAIICMLFLILFSVIMSTRNIPQGVIGPMSVFAMCAGAFCSGIVASRLNKAGGLLLGAICGAILTFIVLCAAMIGGSQIGIPALLKTAFIMFSAMIGGVLGVNSKRGRKL